MEIESNKNSKAQTFGSEDKASDLIIVRAIISCPTCSFKKKFKNQFHRDQMEYMIVALKVFDWMACNNCGDLLRLDLEFDI